jgi:hypothetical protein
VTLPLYSPASTQHSLCKREQAQERVQERAPSPRSSLGTTAVPTDAWKYRGYSRSPRGPLPSSTRPYSTSLPGCRKKALEKRDTPSTCVGSAALPRKWDSCAGEAGRSCGGGGAGGG